VRNLRELGMKETERPITPRVRGLLIRERERYGKAAVSRRFLGRHGLSGKSGQGLVGASRSETLRGHHTVKERTKDVLNKYSTTSIVPRALGNAETSSIFRLRSCRREKAVHRHGEPRH
jgi:hypothetical protein